MKRPFITANFAQTWDARISTRNHTPVDFSSPTDKRCLFEIRASADAILCGSRTIATDDATLALPQRSLRAQRIKAGKPPCPLRVLVTNSGRLNPDLKIFSETSAPLLIFSTTRMPARIRRALEEKADLHLTDKPSVDLHAMLAHLHAQRGVERLLCEGGPTLLRSLLEADLVDQLHGGRNVLRLHHTPDLAAPGKGLRRDRGRRPDSERHGLTLLFDESDRLGGHLALGSRC